MRIMDALNARPGSIPEIRAKGVDEMLELYYVKGTDLVYVRLICPKVRSISAKGNGIHSNRINRSAKAETGGCGCRYSRGRPATRFESGYQVKWKIIIPIAADTS